MRPYFRVTPFFLAMMVFVGLAQYALAGDAPRVMKIAGRAEIMKLGQWKTAEPGDVVEPGDSLRTPEGGEISLASEGKTVSLSARSGAEVKYEGRTKAESQPWRSSRLAELQSLQFGAEDGTEQFSFSTGEVETNVETGAKVRIVTPLVTASVRGTQFVMRVEPDGSSFLNVVSGSIEASNRAGAMAMVSDGMAFGFTTPEFNAALVEAGVLQEGESWQSLPTETLDAVGGSADAGDSGETGDAGSSGSFGSFGSSGSSGNTGNTGNTADSGGSGESASSSDSGNSASSGDAGGTAAASGGGSNAGAAPGGQSPDSLPSLDQLFSDSSIDPMAGDSLLVETGNGNDLFGGDPAPDVAVTPGPQDQDFGIGNPGGMTDSETGYIEPPQYTGPTAASVSGILFGDMYGMSGGFNGVFGFDVNLISGTVGNATMSGRGDNAGGEVYNYSASGGAGSLVNTGSDIRFGIYNFTGTVTVESSSILTPGASYSTNNITRMDMEALNGIDQVGNAVNGYFHMGVNSVPELEINGQARGTVDLVK